MTTACYLYQLLVGQLELACPEKPFSSKCGVSKSSNSSITVSTSKNWTTGLARVSCHTVASVGRLFQRKRKGNGKEKEP